MLSIWVDGRACGLANAVRFTEHLETIGKAVVHAFCFCGDRGAHDIPASLALVTHRR